MASEHDPTKRPPNMAAERLRNDIDAGRTGDKVPYPDPAAAPLGTDDEAAGTRPPPAIGRDREVPEDARIPPGQKKGPTKGDPYSG